MSCATNNESSSCNCNCGVETPYSVGQPMYVLAKHNTLTGRDEESCHPISAITGLAEKLEGLDPKYNVTVEEFTPEETSQYSKGYKIIQNSVEKGTIYIPKGSAGIASGECKICTVDDTPQTGLKKGDRYLDFTLTDNTHIYIALANVAYEANNLTTSNVVVTIDKDTHKISADFTAETKAAFDEIHTHSAYTAAEIQEAINQGWNAD